MNFLIVLATAVPILAALGVIIFTVRNVSELTPSKLAPPSSISDQRISVEDLGGIELRLQNLKRVLVVANKIERPEGSLARAVESNFKKGVDYLFLISRSKAATEKTRYYKLFEAYASMSGADNSLLDIKALPFEWDDYPIIFYQTRDTKGILATIAFRGTELREGIAEYYQRVPAEYAHTIATTLLSDAPSDVEASAFSQRGVYENGAAVNVTDISTRRRS